MALPDASEGLNPKPPDPGESPLKELKERDPKQPKPQRGDTTIKNDDRKRKYSELDTEDEEANEIQSQNTCKKRSVRSHESNSNHSCPVNSNSSSSSQSNPTSNPSSNFTTDSPLIGVVANQVPPQITGSLFTDLSTANPTVQTPEDDDDEDTQENPWKPITLISTPGNFTRNETFTNIYLLSPVPAPARRSLRPIVIDGSNVAMSHGKGKTFSVQGLLICMNYFIEHGHSVKAFLPQFRQQLFPPHQLKEVTERGLVIFTPSRMIGYDGKKRILSYDDRYILQYATLYGGIVVSNDYFRDLYDESEDWNETIRKRILPFTWASDGCLMFPADPLGRNSPKLDDFLRFP